MDDHLDLRCIVCLECYSDTRPPRSLECGHSVCTLCLKAMEEYDNSRECPECRHYHKAKSYIDLRINHPLLRFGRMCSLPRKYAETISSLDLSYPGSNPDTICAGVCSSHGHGLYFRCLRCETYICRDCLLCDHLDPPYGYCNIADIKVLVDNRKSPLKSMLELDLKKLSAEKVKYDRVFKQFKKLFKFADENLHSHNGAKTEKILGSILKHKEEVESHINAYGAAVEKIQETMERLLKSKLLEELESFCSVSWEDLPVGNKYRIKGIRRKLLYLESKLKVEVQNPSESVGESETLPPNLNMETVGEEKEEI